MKPLTVLVINNTISGTCNNIRIITVNFTICEFDLIKPDLYISWITKQLEFEKRNKYFNKTRWM